MNVSINMNTAALARVSEKIAEAARRTIQTVASEAIALMVSRVSRGVGNFDQPLAAYSKRYAAHRKARGRQANLRDLTFSGRLLSSIAVLSVTSDGGVYRATIGLSDARSRELAIYQHYTQNTPWFGLSPKNIEDLRAAFAGALAQNG